MSTAITHSIVDKAFVIKCRNHFNGSAEIGARNYHRGPSERQRKRNAEGDKIWIYWKAIEPYPGHLPISGGATPGRTRSNDLAGRLTDLARALAQKYER